MPLDQTDFVNSSQTLKKTTFKLLNELANLNSYFAELNTELPPNDSYPSFPFMEWKMN